MEILVEGDKWCCVWRRDSGFLKLFFNFTGTHEGTEHLGDITFLDASFVHGFTLSLSEGSGVDTMQWTRATIFPAFPASIV